MDGELHAVEEIKLLLPSVLDLVKAVGGNLRGQEASMGAKGFEVRPLRGPFSFQSVCCSFRMGFAGVHSKSKEKLVHVAGCIMAKGRRIKPHSYDWLSQKPRHRKTVVKYKSPRHQYWKRTLLYVSHGVHFRANHHAYPHITRLTSHDDTHRAVAHV